MCIAVHSLLGMKLVKLAAALPRFFTITIPRRRIDEMCGSSESVCTVQVDFGYNDSIDILPKSRTLELAPSIIFSECELQSNELHMSKFRLKSAKKFG